MSVIAFENVSKKYKLYSKGGLYLRDRVTHALGRFNPFNGRSPVSGSSAVAPLERDFWALKNVSFEIKQGESVGFIGRNGAGKSTILKLLAGVTKPSSGSMGVRGKVAALIEVGAGFHPELTGRENIYLNGSILGMRKVEIEECFNSIVSFAELQDFIDTPVKHYSSGMYVRLGFAIATHSNPDVFLVDEVLSVGDEAFQKKCEAVFENHKAAGKTIILVSHQLDKIAEVCDRCIYVNHGEVRFDGTPKQAITNYRLDVAGITLRQNENSAAGADFGLAVANGTKVSSHFAQHDDLRQCKSESIPANKGRGDGFFLHVRNYDRAVSVSCGDPITLEFDIEAPSPITETTVGVTVVDLNGTPIMSMSSKIQNVPKIAASSRFWRTVCDMGAIPLNSGTYFTHIYVGNTQHDHARFSNVFAIRVVNKDVFGWGDGLPGPESWGATYWAPQWKIEPSSKSVSCMR